MKHIFNCLLMLVLAGCGGGGGGGNAGVVTFDSTPTISNLQYGPTSALQYAGNGIQTVSGTLDFMDAGKDLSTVYLTTSDGSSITSPIQGISGLAAGSIQAFLQADTSKIGQFSFQVYVADTGGRKSNTLSGNFEVKPNDSAGQWTQQAFSSSPSPILWQRRVRWFGASFISVGDAILTSNDAISWTQQSSGITSALNDVAANGNGYVAVGESGKILTSPNATTWTNQTIPNVGTPSLKGVASSGTRMVAVGTQVDAASGNPVALILTSTDGVNWSLVPGTIQVALYAVVWSGNQFVAVGSTSGQPTAQAISLNSSDGLVWSIHSVNVSTLNTLYDIAWNGTLFVSTGYSGAVSSNDGANWQSTGSGVVGPNNAIAWSGQHFLTCGVVYCQVSADGMQWSTAAQLPGSGPAIYGVAWSGLKWAVVGTKSYVASSP